MVLGDAEARNKMGGDDEGFAAFRKLQTERKHDPVFDVVVEVRRGTSLEYAVIKDTARAVDCILRGKPYTKELRRQLPDGRVQVQIVRA